MEALSSYSNFGSYCNWNHKCEWFSVTQPSRLLLAIWSKMCLQSPRLICKVTCIVHFPTSFQNFIAFLLLTPKTDTMQESLYLSRKVVFGKSNRSNGVQLMDCHQFYRENRLLAAQAWYGNGGSSILFYCLYAPSGARWEQPKRKVFNQLLDSIVADVVSRGQIPAVILGDFNMTIEESDKFQELLNHNIFMDARQIASSEHRSSPTCYVGPQWWFMY